MDETGASALEVLPHDLNTARLYPGPGFFEIRQHPIVNQSFSEFDDLNIKVAQFPQLPFGQLPRRVATLPVIPHTQQLDAIGGASFNGVFFPEPGCPHPRFGWRSESGSIIAKAFLGPPFRAHSRQEHAGTGCSNAFDRILVWGE
jgi:hypothetical protein